MTQSKQGLVMQVCIDISYINTHLHQHFAEFIAEIWHKIKIAHTLCSIFFFCSFLFLKCRGLKTWQTHLLLKTHSSQNEVKVMLLPSERSAISIELLLHLKLPMKLTLFITKRTPHFFFQINLQWSARTQKHVCIVCNKGVKLW